MKTPKAKTVEELLAQIRKSAKDGDYIFRGESSDEYPNSPKVTSTLYRVYQKQIAAKNFDIEVVEETIISEVRERTHEKDDDAILEQLQHYGGKTNQIDFSTDYLVALFFACDGNYKADGRLILLNKKGMKTHKPTNPQNRVIAQKSIFVRSPEGFVEPDDEVTVPNKLKEEVLGYLNKYHSISTATIYNDIHGYIAQTAIHESAYVHFYHGLTYQDKREFSQAIKEYTKAIKLNPNYVFAYNNRGVVYNDKGEHDLAITDFNKAIELDSNYAETYNNRGIAYGKKGDYDHSIADFNKSIELNPNYAPAHNNRGFAKKLLKNYKGARVDFQYALQLAKQQKNKALIIEIKKEIDTLPLDSDK